MRTTVLLILWLVGWQPLNAQEAYPLYNDRIPNAVGVLSESEKPFITAHLPTKPAKDQPAIVIFPGGGYHTLVTQTEGAPIAEAFAKHGFAAFVVHYRLPNDSSMTDKHLVPLMDAQQAIHWVKRHHARFNVDTSRVGIIGYSAGGHLAATLGTHYTPALVDNPEQVDLRPAFMVLVYPVVSMETASAHSGSRAALLGTSPSHEQIQFFSAEQNVNEHTPPTYLIHSVTDRVVSVDNSTALFKALCDHGVNAELHLRSKGDHGFVHTFEVDDWINPVLSWLKREGIISGSFLY